MEIKEIIILVECNCDNGWIADYGGRSYRCDKCNGRGKKELTFVLKEEEE